MKSKSFNKLFFLFAVGVAVLWIGWWFFPMRFDYSLGTDKQGQIGDKFGALNTLFTGLALLAVAYSIKHERQAHLEEMEVEKQARKDAEQTLDRQVELAADTARMQALPVLIGLQRDRIAAIQFGPGEAIKQHYLNEVWIVSKIAELKERVATIPSEIVEAERQGRGNPFLDGQGMVIVSPYAPWEALRMELKDAKDAIPELERLAAYLREYPKLYAKFERFEIRSSVPETGA